MHRFRQPLENKFGMKPPYHRINPETIEKSMENALPMVMNEPQPIWGICCSAGLRSIGYQGTGGGTRYWRVPRLLVPYFGVPTGSDHSRSEGMRTYVLSSVTS